MSITLDQVRALTAKGRTIEGAIETFEIGMLKRASQGFFNASYKCAPMYVEHFEEVSKYFIDKGFTISIRNNQDRLDHCEAKGYNIPTLLTTLKISWV